MKHINNRFMDTRRAATYLGLPARTLERWRIEGKGPSYRKFGRRVLYGADDLEEWANAQIRTSTSDTGDAA